MVNDLFHLISKESASTFNRAKKKKKKNHNQFNTEPNTSVY